MKTVLISGLSGAGKSVALAVLEDQGWFCVDNLPLPLLPELAALHRSDGSAKLAVSIDIRSNPDAVQLQHTMQQLRRQGHEAELLFLEADDAVLLRRFSETRRRHPLSGSSTHTLQENLAAERTRMWPLREAAYRIDTSNLHPRELAARLVQWLALPRQGLLCVIESFGFKHRAAPNSDFVFDVRSLPNPYYRHDLRPFNGKDPQICDFFVGQEAVGQMIDDIEWFIGRRLPHLAAEQRSYLNIAIGCTGGQHRSVYVAEQLAARLRRQLTVLVRHTCLPADSSRSEATIANKAL